MVPCVSRALLSFDQRHQCQLTEALVSWTSTHKSRHLSSRHQHRTCCTPYAALRVCRIPAELLPSGLAYTTTGTRIKHWGMKTPAEVFAFAAWVERKMLRHYRKDLLRRKIMVPISIKIFTSYMPIVITIRKATKISFWSTRKAHFSPLPFLYFRFWKHLNWDSGYCHFALRKRKSFVRPVFV